MPPGLEPPKKRRRPALACVQCRRRKVRCDQNRPCNNCTKSRIPDCTFPLTHVPGSQVHAPVTLAPEPQTLSLRDGRQYRPTPGRSIPSATTSPANPPNATPQSRVDGSNVEVLLAKISELKKTVSTLSGANNHRMGSAASPARNGSGHRFGNQSNWMNNTSLYSKILRVLGAAQAEGSLLHETSAKCKILGRQIEKRLSVDTAPAAIGTRIPDRALADELLEGYFGNFEGSFRVLHVPTFRAAYESYWQQRGAAGDLFVLQLQLCMALGAMAHSNALVWRNAASQWLLEAQTWLRGPSGNSKKKPTVEELQLACLVGIAEANASSINRIHQCWVNAGNLLRKAMWAGLHRDPKYLGSMTVRQAEMRRRLWATILELNLLLSLQAGCQPLISVSDYDTCPPANLQDEELGDEQESERPPAVERDKPTATTVQLAFFDSFPARLEIVRKVNALVHDMSYDALLRLHSSLSKAQKIMRQRFAALADPQTTAASSSSYSSSHTALADTLLSRYFLALHLPVLGFSIKDPAFHFSRRFCLATSINIAEASGIIARTNHPAPASASLARLFVNSPGIFRHIASQAVFAIALELITSREEEREDDHASFPVWDDALAAEGRLLGHLQSALEWAADRIRTGLADPQSYCFIAACISYACVLEESGAETADVDGAIVEAAVKGSERCIELLNGVAERISDAPDDLLTTGADDLGGSLEGVDIAFDWVDFMGEVIDGFGLDWTFPVDPGLAAGGGMGLGLMVL